MASIIIRPRRLREKAPLRQMVRETRLSPDDFIFPFFVIHGRGVKEEIASMPGMYHLSVDKLAAEAKEVASLGIPAVLLFGIPETKDERGSGAYDDNGVVQQAIREIKSATPDLMVITDVCLCEYTSHGHCGVVEGARILNDPTVGLLCRMAISHVRAGADMVAPSDMMDGRIGAIRKALDEEGYQDTPIMSYAAKYASAFYGPFREAVASAPSFGTRESYQMDPANAEEALREVALDIEEGADIVMVKPALAYLDIIYRVKEKFGVPVAAYNVSGEYAMVTAASRMGWIDKERIIVETLTSIKRAGADLIITYFAKEAVSLVK